MWHRVVRSAAASPSVSWQVTPSSALKASVIRRARRLRLPSRPFFSRKYWACEGSPGRGGLTMRPSATCPGTLGDRLIEATLYSSSSTAGSMLCSSM